MLGGHRGGDLRGQVVQLHGSDPGVEAADHLHCDLGGVNVVSLQPVAQLLNPAGDLVEVDGLLPPVPLQYDHLAAVNLGHPDGFFYFAVTRASIQSGNKNNMKEL